jgi:hypothetical protein
MLIRATTGSNKPASMQRRFKERSMDEKHSLAERLWGTLLLLAYAVFLLYAVLRMAGVEFVRY